MDFQEPEQSAKLTATLEVPALLDQLYVVQGASGHVKIGRARDVCARVDALRCSNPVEIVCVAIIPEKGAIEGEVLHALRAWKARGEWFLDTQPCRDEIERVLGKRIRWRFGIENSAAAGKPESVDPNDAPELTDGFFADAEYFQGDTFIRRGRGRPKGDVTKELVSIRLDPDVLAKLREAGPGWQTRVNDILRKAVLDPA